jgi:hypothetical protein
MRPFAAAVETWNSLSGIDRITVWTMVAEMGPKMNQFPSVSHTTWWRFVPRAGGAVRKGRKRATVAVAHALLSTGYMLLWSGRRFSELRGYFDRVDRER